MEKLEACVDRLQTRLARLQMEYATAQQRLKQRITALEHSVGTTVTVGSGLLSDADGNESGGDDGARSEINIRL